MVQAQPRAGVSISGPGGHCPGVGACERVNGWGDPRCAGPRVAGDQPVTPTGHPKCGRERTLSGTTCWQEPWAGQSLGRPSVQAKRNRPRFHEAAPGSSELGRRTEGILTQRKGLPGDVPKAMVLTFLPPGLGAGAQCPACLRPGLAPPGLRSPWALDTPSCIAAPVRDGAPLLAVCTCSLSARARAPDASSMLGGTVTAVPGDSRSTAAPWREEAHAAQETSQWALRTPRPPQLPRMSPSHQVTHLVP